MSGAPTPPPDSLLPLLLAFDEGLATGREPALAVPTELAEEFGAAQSVLRLLNQAWPRPAPADTTVDQAPLAGPAAAPPARAEPVRIGRFEVLRELGRGGFGVVYLAHDPLLARRVALKAPRADRWGTPEFRRRFLQEGRAAAQLDHPNVVRVLEAGEAESTGYIASAYCEGPSLAAWLREQKRLPCRLAAALAADLAAGVQHAHEKGVVHRDLKPANILLEIGPEIGSDGLPRKITPKVCDFGLAKMLEGEQTETQPGAVLGTPQYMAPEQAEGRTREVGPAADVYALGVILYELLTDRPPFVGEPGLNLLKQVATAPPERPRRRRKDVPRDLETVVLTCLEKEPQRRYAGAAALEADLRRWLDGKAPLGRPEPALRRVGRWARRRPAWTAAAALAALLAVVGLAAAPFLDPDRPVKQALAHLAEGKPATLIDQAGDPVWFRFRTGEARAKKDVAPDGAFRVHSGAGVALLELLPQPGLSRYRFRAEVRHERVSEPGAVGLYFAHQEHATPRGGVHSFLRVVFDDAGAEMIFPPPGVPMAPLLQPVRVDAVLYSDREHGLGWFSTADLSGARLFRGAGLKGGPWRQLAVEVTPDEVRTFWGADRQPNGDPVGADRWNNTFQDLVQPQKYANPNDPAVQAMAPTFAPQGGLGLYVEDSTASFRNVVVEPLDR